MSQLRTTQNNTIRLPAPLKADQLRMERRRFPRQLLEASVTAVFSAADGRVGVLPLELTDSSVTGLGARTSMHVEAGTRIMICPAGIPIPSRSAIVVHCDAAPDGQAGYEVGLKFDQRRAA